VSYKQKITFAAPVTLVAVMHHVFHLLADVFRGNWRSGWYLGHGVD